MDLQFIDKKALVTGSTAGIGFAIASLLAQEGRAAAGPVRRPHFTPRAKSVIYLFHAGAPSHLELFDPKPELARKGWEYYTANRIWHPNAEISLEGLKFTMEIYAEQTKGPAPDPLKYIDMSYLQQAIKEVGEK